MIQTIPQTLLLDERAMWRAVSARDRAADGLFVFGVRTTGIYCRPACPARRARRENVEFFASPHEAERAGLRACLRCSPRSAVDAPLALCQSVLRAIEAAPAGRWSDARLAAQGFEPVAVRRAFVARYGRTFHAHLRELRVARTRELAAAGLAVPDAGARAGFESDSGLRAAFRAVLGTTPGAALARETLVTARFASPLGPLFAAASARGVCLLEFESGSERARSSLDRVAKRLGCAVVAGANPHLEQLSAELEEWFRGERESFEVALDLAGTEFEREVWSALLRIPFGATRSYGEVARALGRPSASRAVGRANGRNTVAIVVPCHRVIGASGTLTGYAAGLDRKRWLLEHERVARIRR